MVLVCGQVAAVAGCVVVEIVVVETVAVEIVAVVEEKAAWAAAVVVGASTVSERVAAEGAARLAVLHMETGPLARPPEEVAASASSR
jgi:hypothetical protein